LVFSSIEQFVIEQLTEKNKIMQIFHQLCFVNGRGVISHFYRLFSVIDVIDVAQRTILSSQLPLTTSPHSPIGSLY
jgi:hypothetical protein